ncbi:MAG: S41 family peptidase, partial [Clostridiales bacterium]|nr:S41 family peptidase [Clostridiales bacterium]
IEIVQVYEGTPAEEAGLQPGDLIVKVDGNDVDARDEQAFSDAVAMIKGEDGTPVTLGLMRGGQPVDVTVHRAVLSISHVAASMLPGNIGYVAVTQFSGDDVEGFRAALEQFRQAEARGMVVDLRNDPGGYLDHVVSICDMVLPEGLVTYVEDRHGNRTEERSSAEYCDMPMAVIVNENSASGSELFTAAVQDYERGVVVGTTTYGKGIVQTLINFPEDGAGMQLTTASYYSPKGRSIHLTGVEPDIVVEPAADMKVDIYAPDPRTDNQLAAALDALETEIGKR